MFSSVVSLLVASYDIHGISKGGDTQYSKSVTTLTKDRKLLINTIQYNSSYGGGIKKSKCHYSYSSFGYGRKTLYKSYKSTNTNSSGGPWTVVG